MNGSHLVRSGDLITADGWNKLVTYVVGLEERLAQLEANDTTQNLIITDLQFFAPLHIDDDLTVLGKNFGVAQVWVNDTAATVFRQRSDSRIIFSVPALPNWTTAAAAVVKVLNPLTGKSATREVVVAPPRVIVAGDVEVDWKEADPQTLPGNVSNQVVRFFFSVTGEHTSSARFTVEPQLLDLPAVTNIDLLDNNGAVLADQQMDLNPGEVKPFVLRFTLPSLANGTVFRLGVAFKLGGRTFGSTALTAFTIGQPVPSADPNIDLEYTRFDRNPDDQNSTVDKAQSKVFCRVGTNITMRFNLSFLGDAPGIATLSVAPGRNTSGWTMNLTSDTPGQINGTTNRTSTPGLSVTPTQSASPTGELVFQVRRANEPTKTQTRRFQLERR